MEKEKQIYQINKEKWNMMEIITCINELLKKAKVVYRAEKKCSKCGK